MFKVYTTVGLTVSEKGRIHRILIFFYLQNVETSLIILACQENISSFQGSLTLYVLLVLPQNPRKLEGYKIQNP